MPVNVISGRVVLKETGVGLPDLLIVIHDLDPGSPPEDTQVSPEGRDRARHYGLGDRLGSRLTDKAGNFHFSFEDDEFQIRNAKERRPDLQLVVLAPEEPGADPQSRVLYSSSDIRMDAGRTEQYLIRLPGDALSRAGVSLPQDAAVAREETRSVVAKLTRAANFRADLETESRKIAAARIGAVRDQAKRTDEVVERRLVESLTGLTEKESLALNIVPPGKTTEKVVWESAGRRIGKLNGKPAVTGYLVLTEEEAAPFRHGTGWRSDIPAAEIEPILFRTGESADRPTAVSRIDPFDAICRAEAGIDPLTSPDHEHDAPLAGSNGSSGSASGSAGSSNDPNELEVTALDLPRFVGRLINGMVPPEGPANGALGRPKAEDVQRNITGLQIASGPADVTAFHDYHNLQIAFDYVWKQLLDEDVVETGKALAREILDAGGDPLTAMEAGVPPVEAMKRETQYIARTNSPFDKQIPDWAAGDLIIVDGDQKPDSPGGGGSTGGTGTGETGGTGTVSGGGKGPHGGLVGPRPGIKDIGPRPPHELLGELEDMLNEQHKFQVFAPGSTNFGLMVTYRQRWEPLTYQAGDLVHTVTLAPKETRKVTSRRTIKRERSTKETETNLRNRSDESKGTMRADAEVVDRASTKTNFNHNSKGSFNVGYASGDATTTFDRTAEASSQETKKSFHENVLSAAMQLRSEKSWSFETKDVFEDETTDTSEISNNNDELTCSFLYYELERRYRVSEHLHRLTPVVMVAMEVPNPGRRSIDRILLAHSWIINRVLLDDRYRAPLDYLCTRIVGDELGLAQMARTISEIQLAVAQLKQMHRNSEATLKASETAYRLATERRAKKIAADHGEGVIENVWEWAAGSGDEEDLESARLIEDMSRESYERSVREQKDIRMRLDAETAALSGAGQEYAKAYAEHMNRLMEVGGLRAHFKENVLYYMQAIWSFTFKDQIFFSLCNIKAPLLTHTSKTYSLAEASEPQRSIRARPDRIVLEVTANISLNANITVETDAVPLAQIADLDQPLGFKGNYMIFPLRKSNALTDMMMVPYVDSELGLHDPDELGSWTPDDFAHYSRCLLKEHRKAEDLTESQYKALETQLTKQYERIVSSPRRVSDEIIVPTNSLFIEALPGKHPLLEDFKLEHRHMDVEKAREETRKMKLESLRYAARILDNSLDDPEIERQIVINGSSNGVVVPADQ
jgi:hypothetical protein